MSKIQRLVRSRSRGLPANSNDWQNELIYNERGLVSNLANVATILSNGPWAGVFRYNVCESVIEVNGSPPAIRPGPRQLGTGDEETITIWLQKQWALNNVSPVKTFDAIRAIAAQNQYNPITDWLESLYWDGTPRIDSWLTTYARVIDTEYSRAVGEHWLRSVAARGLTPGAKCDHILVLEGRQGDKKSTLFEVLGGRFYAAPPTIIGDRAVQNMSGKLIVCLEELESLEKSEIGALKAQITRRVDRLRLPWARTATDIPRTATLAGTCNRDDYLRDETGNRRFWPVRVGKISIDALERDRDQLLAEAVHQVKQGAQWWLPEHLETTALLEAQSRVMADVWGARVSAFLENKHAVTTEQVLENVGVELARMGRLEQMRVASLLKSEGWQRQHRRIAGQRAWWWVAPGTLPTNELGLCVTRCHYLVGR